MITPTSTPVSPPRIELDWRAYFMRFMELHGGEPVVFEGRLLFRDGWTHSMSDYAGPEWPAPPEPERLKHLKFHYWRIRRSAVREVMLQYQDWVDAVRLQSTKRSAPLQVSISMFDPDANRMTQVKGDLVLKDMEARVAMLKSLVDECDTQLRLIYPEKASTL